MLLKNIQMPINNSNEPSQGRISGSCCPYMFSPYSISIIGLTDLEDLCRERGSAVHIETLSTWYFKSSSFVWFFTKIKVGFNCQLLPPLEEHSIITVPCELQRNTISWGQKTMGVVGTLDAHVEGRSFEMPRHPTVTVSQSGRKTRRSRRYLLPTYE